MNITEEFNNDARYVKKIMRIQKINYECSKDKHIHKYGTKIWESHIDYAIFSSIDITIRVKIMAYLKEEKRKYDIRSKKAFQEWRNEDKLKLNNNEREAKNELAGGRYFAFSVSSSQKIHQVGSYNGWKTIAEMESTNLNGLAYSIKRAKDGEDVIFVMKAEIYKIIKKK